MVVLLLSSGFGGDVLLTFVTVMQTKHTLLSSFDKIRLEKLLRSSDERKSSPINSMKKQQAGEMRLERWMME